MIRPLTETDWPRIKEIFEEGMATGLATLETNAPSKEQWFASHLSSPMLGATDSKDILCGWAALSPVSSRCVYGGVAEVSVYIGAPYHGQGFGKALLCALVENSEAAGIWTLQSGILSENQASIRLHSSCGFRVVGVREKLGRQGDVWKDIVLMERRSSII